MQSFLQLPQSQRDSIYLEERERNLNSTYNTNTGSPLPIQVYCYLNWIMQISICYNLYGQCILL